MLLCLHDSLNPNYHFLRIYPKLMRVHCSSYPFANSLSDVVVPRDVPVRSLQVVHFVSVARLLFACVHGFMPSVSILKIQVVPRLPFHVHDRDQVRYLRQQWLGECVRVSRSTEAWTR